MLGYRARRRDIKSEREGEKPRTKATGWGGRDIYTPERQESEVLGRVGKYLHGYGEEEGDRRQIEGEEGWDGRGTSRPSCEKAKLKILLRVEIPSASIVLSSILEPKS